MTTDFRTDEQRAADRGLLGTWWRCPVHGLTEEAIPVGDYLYCAADPCEHRVIVAHSSWDDPERKATRGKEWRRTMDKPTPKRAEPEPRPVEGSNGNPGPAPAPPPRPTTSDDIRDAIVAFVRERGHARTSEIYAECRARFTDRTMKDGYLSSYFLRLERGGALRKVGRGLWRFVGAEVADPPAAETATPEPEVAPYWIEAPDVEATPDAAKARPEPPEARPGTPEATPGGAEETPPDRALPLEPELVALHVLVTPQIRVRLEELVRSGFWGADVGAAALRVLEERFRRRTG